MRKFFLSFVLFSSLFFAQQNPLSYHVFGFRFDNDVVFGTDRYFTNGFYFSLASSSFSELTLNKFLFPNVTSDDEIYLILLGQEIFTSQEKDSVKPIIGDRPFSANLFLTYTKSLFLRGELIWKFNILLGIMGKHAFGEEVQNGIHWLLPPSGEVRGWGNQLSDAPLIQYGIENLLTISKSSLMKLRSKFIAEIGQPRTRLGVGLIFLVGNGTYENSKQIYSPEFNWGFNFDANLYYVIFNSNLIGGLFTRNIYSISYKDMNKILFNWRNNFEINYKKTHFTIGYELLTIEFRTGKPHLWFYTEIKYLF